MAAEDDISQQPWFWGQINKEEANKILMEHEHGHFLVRDSTTPGDYTLVVRKKGKVRNIRIQRNPNGYGLEPESCDFKTVAELIDYLLSNHNVLRRLFPNLDLVQPVCKPAHDKSDDSSTYEMLTELVAINEKYHLRRQAYEVQLQEKERTDKELQQCKTIVTSMKTVLFMYEEQLALQSALLSGSVMRPAEDVETPDHRGLTINRDTTLARMEMLREKLELELRKVTSRETTAQQQLVEMHQHNTKLAAYDKDIFARRLIVEERGIQPLYLDLLLREETESDLSRYDEENWRVPWSKVEAVNRLANAVPGTFLVRRSSKGGHALSIVCDMVDFAETRHCMIYQSPDSGRYGFHAEYCIFNSIKELVIKHRTISLKYYNSSMDVCLTYPINYTSNDT